MYLTMKRILFLQILTSLKIAVIIANSVHSCFLCICKVIADIFQLPTTHLLNDSPSTEDNSVQTIPLVSSPKVSIFTQTDKVSKQSENIEEKSSTDVIIYNLNSSQKLIITHDKFRSNQYEQCKSATEISSLEKVKDVAVSTTGSDSLNNSYMSIESDILDSKIENGCRSSSNYSDEEASLKAFGDGCYNLPVDIEDSGKETLNVDYGNYNSVFMDFKKLDNVNLNACKNLFSVSENSERLREISDNTYLERNDMALHAQKTSSPLKKLVQSPQTPCTNFSIFNKDQKSKINENKDADISFNFDYWENGETSGKAFKRRLSLPAKLNTTKTAVINFKLAQKKLIEDALKNTPRHEKSLKEIKYPFSSEISLGSRPNEEIEDKVFSCSSYESLPVSDHLRSAFENSTLLNLYSENLHSEDGKPDFSCVDNLVEAFNDKKSSLSVANLIQSKVTQYTMSKSETKEEIFESLNINGSLQQNSSGDQKLNDCSKLLDASKDTQLGTDKGRKISNLTSEKNSSNVLDVQACNVLDVTSKEKLAPEKFSGFFDKDAFRNDLIKSDFNFGNDEKSETKELASYNSTAKEKEFFGNSHLKQESEEENYSDENKLNQMKCISQSSLQQIFPDACESTDFENTVLSLKDKGKTNYSDNPNLLKTRQQSYNKIVFIDESPSDKVGNKYQNISNTNYQDHNLKDEKPTLIEEHTSRDIEVETIEPVEYNTLVLPGCEMKCLQSNEMIGESTKRNKGKRNIVNFRSFESLKLPMDSCLVNYQTRTFATRRMNRNILKTNYQDNSLNEDQKIMTHKTVSRDSVTQTNESDSDDSFPIWSQSCNKTVYIDQSSTLEKSRRYQNSSETNFQEHYSLIEDRKPILFEENASSEDSISDNSVVTKNDLSDAED